MDRGYELTALQLLYADPATIINYCRTNKVSVEITDVAGEIINFNNSINT